MNIKEDLIYGEVFFGGGAFVYDGQGKYRESRENSDGSTDLEKEIEKSLIRIGEDGILYKSHFLNNKTSVEVDGVSELRDSLRSLKVIQESRKLSETGGVERDRECQADYEEELRRINEHEIKIIKKEE